MPAPFRSALQLAVRLDPAVLADPEEDDPVDRQRNCGVELPLGEFGIPECDVPGEEVPPGFDLPEEGLVHAGSPLLQAARFGVTVEGAFEDCLLGEDRGNLVPAGGVLPERNQQDTGRGGPVGMVRFDPAVVDGEFLEVGQDGERQPGGPCVAAELVGGGGIPGDVDGGFLRLDEEFPRTPDAEAVVRGLHCAAYPDGVLVDNVLVGLGMTCRVVYIPTQSFEERIDKFPSELGLVVGPGGVCREILLKPFDQFNDLMGSRHDPSFLSAAKVNRYSGVLQEDISKFSSRIVLMPIKLEQTIEP